MAWTSFGGFDTDGLVHFNLPSVWALINWLGKAFNPHMPDL
jgi:hypothetical protein